MASVIAYDWLDGKDLSLNASRSLTVLLGALVVIAALTLLPLLGNNVRAAFDIINTIAGTLLGGLMAMFFCWACSPAGQTRQAC